MQTPHGVVKLVNCVGAPARAAVDAVHSRHLSEQVPTSRDGIAMHMAKGDTVSVLTLSSASLHGDVLDGMKNEVWNDRMFGNKSG